MRVGLLTAFALGCAGTPSTGADDYGIVSVASSFGECAGACVQTVTFDPPLTLTISGWTPEKPYAVQSGAFTSAGTSEFAEVGRTLDGGSLEAQYGCPDCADGGAMTLVLDVEGIRQEHTWEFSNPPDELHQVDTLFHHVRDALADCESTVWVAPDAGCVAYSNKQ